MTTDTTTPPAASEPEPDGVEDVEDLAQAIDVEENGRKWLRAITSLVEHRSTESDPSDRVQLALDKLMIAACERGGRILRSDLGADQG